MCLRMEGAEQTLMDGLRSFRAGSTLGCRPRPVIARGEGGGPGGELNLNSIPGGGGVSPLPKGQGLPTASGFLPYFLARSSWCWTQSTVTFLLRRRRTEVWRGTRVMSPRPPMGPRGCPSVEGGRHVMSLW